MARKIHKRKAADSPERMSLSQYLSSFSGPIVFFLVIVTTIFVMSIFFRITNIQVEGNTHYTDEEIIQAIDIEEGDNLFFFDRFSALSRVFAKLPYVEEVSVERSLPNKVIITVTESQALAYIALGDEMWSIDHSCKVLGKATEEELADLYVQYVEFSDIAPVVGQKNIYLLSSAETENEAESAAASTAAAARDLILVKRILVLRHIIRL